jgi:acetyl-CoA carboxylase biotin carboxyl carrier protein
MSPASPSSKATRSPIKPDRPARPQRTNGAAVPAVEMARELAAIVEAHSLSELVLEAEGVSLTLRRGVPAHPAHAPVGAPAPMHVPLAVPPMAVPPAAPAPVEDSRHAVTCPFVGTFYRAPSPEAEPYVREGDRVEKGQVICIVEAMKLMNEIEADVSGTIAAILVENGKTVEYGQPLFRIELA